MSDHPCRACLLGAPDECCTCHMVDAEAEREAMEAPIDEDAIWRERFERKERARASIEGGEK